MKITKANLTRIMRIDDPAARKAKLQEMCLSIGWHGEIWQEAMNELQELNDQGVKTALERKLEQ